MLNQIGDGADLQTMMRRKRYQVRQTRHLAVVFQNLADHRCRHQAREARQIAARFGVTGTHQHAAFLRAQRKDMSRLHQIALARVRTHRRAHRGGAIGRRNAGGHTFGGLDGNGEIGAQRRTVVRHHQRQVKLAATIFGQRQTNQSAPVARHEIDRFGGGVFRRDQEIALVLAIFFIDQNHHAPGANFGDDFRRRTDGDGCRG